MNEGRCDRPARRTDSLAAVRRRSCDCQHGDQVVICVSVVFVCGQSGSVTSYRRAGAAPGQRCHRQSVLRLALDSQARARHTQTK